MFFRMLYDDKLAQASYVIGCQRNGEAIVIDPQRDVDRYIEFVASHGLRITAITETHIHADFLSGARELAERTDAHIYLSDEGGDDWKYQWLDKMEGGGRYNHQLVKDGDTFKVGNIQFEVLHTPGHTPEHISFLVTDLGVGATEPMGIATGDFVFVGSVGRPDLLETAAGLVGTKESSARVLYRSIQRFKELPEYLQVWPGHGSGSACGKALGAVPQTTVGYEKRYNGAIHGSSDETRFVDSILNGQTEPPMYFSRMKRDNKEGPVLLGALPEPMEVTVNALEDILGQDCAILDTRPWSEFIKGHLLGALFTPLNSSFPTVAGSYVEPDTPIYLIVEEGRVREAVIALIRIGLDKVVGYATPDTLHLYASQGGELGKTKTINIRNLLNRKLGGNELILDVRNASEYNAGHLPGALNVAHTRLLAHLNEVPKERPVLVHCRASIRSAFATALLERYGFHATMLTGGFIAWSKAGGTTVHESTATA